MITMLALLALMSGPAEPPAHPIAVSVQVAGKSPAALRAELKAASETVCRAELGDPSDASDRDQCVGATYDAALDKMRRSRQADRPAIRNALLVR